LGHGTSSKTAHPEEGLSLAKARLEGPAGAGSATFETRFDTLTAPQDERVQSVARVRYDTRMPYSTILFSNEGGIARLTLNRPERLNSFTVEMHEEVADALSRLEGARVLVLTGAGRGFCAGQDLNDRAVAPGERVDLGESVEERYNPLIRTLTSLPMPVIARVNGVAAGAGANIALACDIVVAAKSAKFIQSFANIGLIPDSGGTWVLPRLVGQARALGLALTAEPLPAEKAAEWGMIWKAVDDEALDAEVDALAAKLAAAPPLGLARIKTMIRESWSHSLDEELDLQRDAMRELGYSDDYREGVAAFMEKRSPKFTGK
jgi:2-(1,2-epoxy-1,2-dihydrophenyl)acetyl-CoA isomerase